jgi:hypothetical protein
MNFYVCISNQIIDLLSTTIRNAPKTPNAPPRQEHRMDLDLERTTTTHHDDLLMPNTSLLSKSTLSSTSTTTTEATASATTTTADATPRKLPAVPTARKPSLFAASVSGPPLVESDTRATPTEARSDDNNVGGSDQQTNDDLQQHQQPQHAPKASMTSSSRTTNMTRHSFHTSAPPIPEKTKSRHSVHGGLQPRLSSDIADAFSDGLSAVVMQSSLSTLSSSSSTSSMSSLVSFDTTLSTETTPATSVPSSAAAIVDVADQSTASTASTSTTSQAAPTKRTNVASEILSSEQSYVASLV